MIPYYEWFYNVLLTSANSVPIQSLWVAFFVNPAALNRAIQASFLENGGPAGNLFSLSPGAAKNTLQSANGILFANSVTIPGEGVTTSKIGPEGMGPIKGTISSGRAELENLTISFLDTNQSFCDYNLRPWTIYANHKSLKDPTVKTIIFVMQLAKTGSGNALRPRAIWTFNEACPVSIKSEEWNYGGDNVVSRAVEFAYNYYTLNADPTLVGLVKDLVEQSGQPVSIPKGGITTDHGSPSLVNINPNDTEEGIQSQQVKIPEDDVVSRGLNIGLDILNGNSNVEIASDDAIQRLRIQAEEIQASLKNPNTDTPNHSSGTSQAGHTPKEPVGPIDGLPDHVTRDAPEKEQSGKISVGGNSKQNAKDNADTPLFFPGDGGEEGVKVGGRTVGGELDTPEMTQLTFKQVVVEKTGDVGKNIPLQIITIDKDDAGGQKKPTGKIVNTDQNDTVERVSKLQTVIVDTNDDETNVKAQLVEIERNDRR